MKRGEAYNAYRASEIAHIRRTQGDFAAFVNQNMERFVEYVGPVTSRYQIASLRSVEDKLSRIPYTSPVRDRMVEKLHTNSTFLMAGVFFLELAGRAGMEVIASKLTNSQEAGLVAAMVSPSVMNLGLNMGSALGRGVNGLRERAVARFARN